MCCIGHTLQLIQHILLLVLLIVAMETQLQLRGFAMKLIGLSVAALIASMTQPVFNVCYYWFVETEAYEIDAKTFMEQRDAELQRLRAAESEKKLVQERRRSKRRSVYIIEPSPEPHAPHARPANQPYREKPLDINDLYVDSDDEIPPFLPQSNEEVSSRTGSSSSFAAPAGEEDVAIKFDMFGDFDEFGGADQPAGGGGTVFDLFDDLDCDEMPVEASPEDHNPAKLMEALECMDFEANFNPQPSHLQTKDKEKVAFDFDRMAAAFENFEEELKHQQLETAPGSVFAQLSDTSENPFDDFDAPLEDNDAMRMFAPFPGAARVRPSLPQQPPPEHLRRFVNGQRNGSAAFNFLDDVLDDAHRDDVDPPLVVLERHELEQREFMVAMEDTAFDELAATIRENRAVFIALQPLGGATAIEVLDGTLRVATLATHHLLVTVGYGVSCIALLMILYLVLNLGSVDSLCGESAVAGTQLLYGLMMDLIVQIMSPLVLFAYRSMQSSELGSSVISLHPYNEQETITVVDVPKQQRTNNTEGGRSIESRVSFSFDSSVPQAGEN